MCFHILHFLYDQHINSLEHKLKITVNINNNTTTTNNNNNNNNNNMMMIYIFLHFLFGYLNDYCLYYYANFVILLHLHSILHQIAPWQALPNPYLI